MGLLEEPRLRGVPPGTPRFFEIQRSLIQQRPLLREIYELWYQRQLEDERTVPGDPQGPILELGSGGSFLAQRCPRVIPSDVEPGIVERVIDARALPFADASLRAICLSHVFHHIPDVEAFLDEARRTLVPGGVIAIIDIPHTPFARFFFDRFHPEDYDDTAPDWPFAQGDSMRDANQALSWIVFFRDRARFERRFPELRVEVVEWLPWLSYLVSGGVTKRNLVPGWLAPWLRRADRLLAPLDPWMALHWHLRIRKLAPAR